MPHLPAQVWSGDSGRQGDGGPHTPPVQRCEQHCRAVSWLHGVPCERQAQRRFPSAPTVAYRVQHPLAQLCRFACLPCRTVLGHRSPMVRQRSAVTPPSRERLRRAVPAVMPSSPRAPPSRVPRTLRRVPAVASDGPATDSDLASRSKRSASMVAPMLWSRHADSSAGASQMNCLEPCWAHHSKSAHALRRSTAERPESARLPCSTA